MSFDFLDMFGIKGPAEPAPKPVVPKPKSEVGDPAEAAKALAAGLDADTGRRKSLGHWRKLVGDALGVSRLSQKRYDAVLQVGESLGLFTIDSDTGSYPFLVRTQTQEVEPEPEPVAEPEAPEILYRSTDDLEPTPPAQTVPTDPGPDWDPPGHLDCGHWTHQKVMKTEEECSESEKKRLSDPQSVKPYKMIRVTTPDDCHYCKLGRPADSYQHQKGRYRQPVPMGKRRTVERDQGLGWPGLCCDEEGYYIGGLTNNCQSSGDGKLCTCHAKLRESRRGS